MDGRRLTHIAWITAVGLLAACGRPQPDPAGRPPSGATGVVDAVSDLKPDEGVRLFPTLARWTPEGGLVVPIRGWVFEPGDARLDAFDGSARDRLAPFLVDSERGKRIVVRIAGDAFRCEPSDEKGQFAGDARLPPHHPALDALRAEAPAWLPLAVVTPAGDARAFDGAALVPAKEGVAIVCDLDDTLKVSNVRNPREQFDAAILEDWVAVAGMPALVRTIADETGATTHYLSAARW